MEYIDLNNELSKRMEKAQTELEGIQTQLDNWRKNGFFYRLTHRRELRELIESRDGAADTIDSIMQEQSDLSRRIDIYQENQFNTRNELLSKVTEEITQHAREEGLYLSKDFEVVNFSDLEAPEKNPQFDDYSWGIIHGDGHPEYFQAESIQDLIDKAVEYGDMIPVSLENQEKIIAEIKTAYHFDKDERVSLQNSDHGLQVVVSEVDEFRQGNHLLNKKITYDELAKHIEAFEENDYTFDGKRMYPAETEYDKGLERSLEAAKEELSQKGLYLSNDIYVSQSGPTFDDYALTMDYQVVSYHGDRLDSIPTKDNILAFAEENKIITRINPEEQKILEEELNKVTFGSDEVPFSYSTLVGDLAEVKEGPFFRLFDDTDNCFDTLSYNAKEDSWNGDKYGFKVDNPVSSLKEKYQDLALEITRSEHEKHVHKELKEIAQKMGKSVPEKNFPTVDIAPYVHKVEDLDMDSNVRFLVQNEVDGKTEIFHHKSVNELFEQMDDIGLVDKLTIRNEVEKSHPVEEQELNEPELEI